jgi:hypothetical protein
MPVTPFATRHSHTGYRIFNIMDACTEYNMTINKICPGLAMIFGAANSGPVKTRANGSWTIYTYRAL